MSCSRNFIICEDKAALGSKLYNYIKEASEKAIRDHGFFAIGLSGGSLIDIIASSGLLQDTDVNFAFWKVFLVDERAVALDSKDSNYYGIKTKLSANDSPMTESQIFPVEGIAEAPLDESAAKYSQLLQNHLGTQVRLDLCLLGMGPDGHTASLFPNHHSFNPSDERLVVPVTDSPKPPPSRVSMSLPFINASVEIMFVVTGAEKAPALKSIIRDNNLIYPAAQVHPEKCRWLLDTTSASELQ
jgi:6-phosphogluconolactonase